MDENDGILCLGDCNFEVRSETRRDTDGRMVVETVERCVCCGYVLSREIDSRGSEEPAL